MSPDPPPPPESTPAGLQATVEPVVTPQGFRVALIAITVTPVVICSRVSRVSSSSSLAIRSVGSHQRTSRTVQDLHKGQDPGPGGS